MMVKAAPHVDTWHWKPWMDEVLRSEYTKGTTSAELAKRLGRTPEAIRKRAERLGISSGFHALQSRHGISRYKAGCRCNVCRAANTATHRRHLVSKRLRTG